TFQEVVLYAISYVVCNCIRLIIQNNPAIIRWDNTIDNPLNQYVFVCFTCPVCIHLVGGQRQAEWYLTIDDWGVHDQFTNGSSEKRFNSMDVNNICFLSGQYLPLNQ